MEETYQFEILCKYRGDGEWEHCSFAVDKSDRDYLLGEYRLAYGAGYSFRVIKYKEVG